MARKVVEDVEVELVRVDRDELGKMLCEKLLEVGKIRLLKSAVHRMGYVVSAERIRRLLREYCPELYRYVARRNSLRYLAKLYSDDDCLL